MHFNGWIDIHVTQKINGLVTHTTWMNLKGITLNERSHLKRSESMIPFMQHSLKDNTTVMENRSMIARDYGWCLGITKMYRMRRF